MASRTYHDVDKVELRNSEDQLLVILHRDGKIEKFIASVEKYPSMRSVKSDYLFFGTFDEYREATDEFSVS